MTHYFIDPLSGADYPFKGRLTSAQMNAWIEGIRDIDETTFWQALQFTALAGNRYTVGEHSAAGMLIAPYNNGGNGEAQTFISAAPLVTASIEAIQGADTTSDVAVAAYNGSDRVVFAYDDTAYVYTGEVSATILAYTFVAITHVDDLLWSPYSSRFYACGSTNTATAGRIESSTDGTSWLTSASKADGGFTAMAADPTGRYILALPTASSVTSTLYYSSNGGTGWSAAAISVGGDAVWGANGVAYDDQRGLWLMTLDSTFSGTRTQVYSTTDPINVAWSATGVALPDIQGNAVTDLTGIITFGSDWIVAAHETSVGTGTVFISSDAGATWGNSLGIGANGGKRLRRCGRRLAITPRTSDGTIYLSNPLWPDSV